MQISLPLWYRTVIDHILPGGFEECSIKKGVTTVLGVDE
jgi:hypothetical protein